VHFSKLSQNEVYYKAIERSSLQKKIHLVATLITDHSAMPKAEPLGIIIMYLSSQDLVPQVLAEN